MNPITNDVRTQVLIQALPYIQRYTGKVIVVNYSGGATENADNKAVMDAFVGDIVLLSLINVKVVLVHGDCEGIEEMLRLSAAINSAGGKALALCGADKDIVLDTLANGYIPVVAAVGLDENGKSVKVSADMAAAKLAGELKAENIIAVTRVRGILTDPNDEATLIPELSIADVPYYKSQGVISGSMTDKVDSCVEAIRRGVKKGFILNGRISHAILIELFSDEGIGTMLI